MFRRELGVPFSDPLADGPVIQASNQRALESGVNFQACIDFVSEARRRGLTVPVVLMGYYNPILAYGEEKAVKNAKESGADGFIVVDLPPEEASGFIRLCRASEMSYIPLVALTTREDRLGTVADSADSFLYCVSVTGVTGARKELSSEVPAFLDRVRRYAKVPLAVGFGISDRTQFLQVAGLAEGVVIGTAIIKAIFANEKDPVHAAEEFCRTVSS